MGKKAVEDAAATEEPAGGGKKKLLLIGGGAAVALALAWFLLLGPGSGGAAPAEAAEPVAGEVVTLEPMTMNLADGRLLKVGLAIQLEEAEEAEEGRPWSGAKALDEAISVLGGLTYEQLTAPGGREKAKQELSTRVVERYEHGVMGVLFTEFVMQ